jgi:hypothetical protein
MKYIGLRAFQGQDDEFRFATRQGDTNDEIRRLVSQRIALGLARYLAKGADAGRLRLSFTAPDTGARGASRRPHDPWNLWVFTAGVNASVYGESQSSSSNWSGSFRARRVTEQWKVSASVNGNWNRSRYDLVDQVLKTSTSSYSFSSTIVRSLGEHWSFGWDMSARRSSTDNYDLLASIAPGLEYDLFPYKESTRRQFVLLYRLGVTHANYSDTTIYNKLEETRPFHDFTAALEATQPWGSMQASLRASNYLDDFAKNRLSLSAGCDLRIVRGLNFNLYGSYSRVHDQLSLVKGGATDEEVLLRLKQLKTSYFYNLFTGLSYTFGSKFNNIVNPRFSSGGGGSCFCSGGSCFCN